jgi:hypothetical protein
MCRAALQVTLNPFLFVSTSFVNYGHDLAHFSPIIEQIRPASEAEWVDRHSPDVLRTPNKTKERKNS